jgi:hypothetical protein
MEYQKIDEKDKNRHQLLFSTRRDLGRDSLVSYGKRVLRYRNHLKVYSFVDCRESVAIQVLPWVECKGKGYNYQVYYACLELNISILSMV